MTHNFGAYLQKLRETAVEEQTEHTSRSALEKLLEEFASAGGKQNIKVQHEPKRERGFGAPDFKIKSKGMILGLQRPSHAHCEHQ